MFLSFIVPVYNVEKYLPECLDSLLDQDISHEEYEIICVNDGSTDRSLAVLREYEEKYANIRVINQRNSGVSSARNAGIEAARGDYIWMVDSDDLIAHNILKGFQEMAKTGSSDILEFGAYSFSEELTETEKAAYLEGTLPAISFANHVYITRSLYRREFLNRNSMRFDIEVSYSEDSLFICQCLLANPSVIHMDRVGYLFRYRSGSTTTLVSPEAIQRKLQSSRIASLKFREFYGQAENALKGSIADLLMSNLWQTLYVIVGMPSAGIRKHLKELRADGVYPFVRPKECSLHRSYQTSRTDVVGEVFDKVYINMHRPWGFWTMVLLQRLISAKKKLVK